MAEWGRAFGALDVDEFVVRAEHVAYFEAGGLVRPGADEVAVQVGVAWSDVLNVFVVAPFVPGGVPCGEVEGGDTSLEKLFDLSVEGFEVSGADFVPGPVHEEVPAGADSEVC